MHAGTAALAVNCSVPFATVSAEADLQFRYGNGRDMWLSGPLTIEGGGYTLNFRGLVKKEFELVQGGTVIWNGNVVALDQLEGYFRTEAARNPQPELHVRPERRANYDTVAKVLAIAQRNGMQRIGFVGNEQFLE